MNTHLEGPSADDGDGEHSDETAPTARSFFLGQLPEDEPETSGRTRQTTSGRTTLRTGEREAAPIPKGSSRTANRTPISS